MLEQLLLRIARRGAVVSQADPSTQSPLNASSIAGQQSAAFFPLLRSKLRLGDGADASADLWARAVQSTLAAQGLSQALPTVFETFGPSHVALAQLLMSEPVDRMGPSTGLVHILGPEDLVAVFNPLNDKVWVAPDLPVYTPEQLALQAMPVTAGLPDMVQTHFHGTSFAQLLWYCGQTVPDTVHALPQGVGNLPLELRRFPPVDPQALEMRHLALLRLFSAGPLTFAQLLANTNPVDHPYLCLDLASLYLTGALALAPQAS
jgi:hypothetical protein